METIILKVWRIALSGIILIVITGCASMRTIDLSKHLAGNSSTANGIQVFDMRNDGSKNGLPRFFIYYTTLFSGGIGDYYSKQPIENHLLTAILKKCEAAKCNLDQQNYRIEIRKIDLKMMDRLTSSDWNGTIASFVIDTDGEKTEIVGSANSNLTTATVSAGAQEVLLLIIEDYAERFVEYHLKKGSPKK